MKLEWKTCFKIGVTAFIFYLGIFYWEHVWSGISSVIGATSPLLIGCAIAYIINIPMSFFEKIYFPRSNKKFFKKTRSAVSLVTSLILTAAVISLITGLIVPQLVSGVSIVIKEMPGTINALLNRLEDYNLISEKLVSEIAGIDWQSRIGDIASFVSTGIGNVMDLVFSTVFSVFSGMVTGIISVIFASYLLMNKKTILRQISSLTTTYLPKRIHDKIYYVTNILNSCFRGFIISQCAEALIMGVLCLVGMIILGLPYYTMISALIAFTALVPVAGAYIGAGIGVLMILSKSPIGALVFLIFIIVLQEIEDNFIYPRIVGSSVGLPAIWVLAAIIIGSGIMGVIGMIISVPVAATVYRILKENLNKKQGLKTNEQ